jgi:hypothetical protein
MVRIGVIVISYPGSMTNMVALIRPCFHNNRPNISVGCEQCLFVDIP